MNLLDSSGPPLLFAIYFTFLGGLMLGYYSRVRQNAKKNKKSILNLHGSDLEFGSVLFK
jgi:hypothetical protein